ncbi:MAG: hypothetical protein ABIC96_04225 [Patescibacteria group bacterium]
MKILSSLLAKFRNSKQKTSKRIDKRSELFIEQGRMQFKELLKKGLSVPVTLL